MSRHHAAHSRCGPQAKWTAAYIRVSTDSGDTARQHTAVRQWSERNHVPIDKTYEDHGRRHEPEKRPEFQALIKDIEAKKIGRVVIDAQDRLGFASVFQWYHYLYLFQRSNAQLIQAIDGKNLTSEDPASFITTGIGAHASREEMVKKSSRDLGKKREMAKRGEWPGGWVPLGCDVICRGATGVERWRVVTDGKWKRYRLFPDGRTERWDGKDAFPRDRQPGDILILDRTVRAERFEILRTIFGLFLEGWPYCKISQHLNSLGPEYWHPHGPWYPTLVKGILRNPAVIGQPAYNKRAHGMYSELGEDGQVRLDPPRHPDNPLKALTSRKRHTSEWIVPDVPLFEPIIEPEDFWRAWQLLDSIKPRTRAPKSDRLWLSGLVICGKCGRAMCGWSEDGWDSYTCSTFRKHGANNPAGCRLHRVRVEVIEQHLDTYLADLGRSLDSLVKGGESGLLQALFRSLDRDKDRLKDLRTRMEGYLMEALEEIIEPVRLPGGRKRFEIDTPDGFIRLDLPGCTDPHGLEYLYDWVSSVKCHERDTRVRELGGEVERLYRQWAELEGLGSARDLVRREMSRVDAELARLKANDLDLSAQVRDTWKAISARSVELGRARRELARGSLRARSLALRGVLDRIVLWFRYEQHGQQLRSRLASLDFVPLLGDPVKVCTDEPLREENSPERD